MKSYEALKAGVITFASEQVAALREDIETGIKEGIYDAADNLETMERIECINKTIEAFRLAKPTQS